MSSKMYCFGARSTERFIQEPGQCAVIKQRLFRSEAAAREYFRGEGSEFEIVRVTIEPIDDCSELETRTAPEPPEKTWDCICGRSNYVTVTSCEHCGFQRATVNR